MSMAKTPIGTREEMTAQLEATSDTMTERKTAEGISVFDEEDSLPPEEEEEIYTKDLE